MSTVCALAYKTDLYDQNNSYIGAIKSVDIAYDAHGLGALLVIIY